jgi:cytochrome c553
MRPSQATFIFTLFLLSTVANAQTVEQKAQVCTACHGANGTPLQKDYPVIWGQQLGYIFIELRDFKTGARKNDLMSPIAQTLDVSDLMPLAQYFSQKPWPNLGQPPATGEVAAQAERVNAASVCTSCHQEGFRGVSTTPRLAGQNHDYLAKTMTDFRTGGTCQQPRHD